MTEPERNAVYATARKAAEKAERLLRPNNPLWARDADADAEDALDELQAAVAALQACFAEDATVTDPNPQR